MLQSIKHVNVLCMFLSLIFLCYADPLIHKASADSSASYAAMAYYMNTELNDLPKYCQYRLAESKFREIFKNKNVPKRIDWPPQFGIQHRKYVRIFDKDNWKHFHHYCFGIQRLNNYHRMSFEQKKHISGVGTLNSALETFVYMEKRATPSFPLWSKLYMYEAQIYNFLGQPKNAAKAMKRAIWFKNKKK